MPLGDGSADLAPTQGFFLFWQANEWGQSARKFLTGKDGPLLHLEWKLWRRFDQARAKYEQQRSKGKRIAPGTNAAG